MGPDLSFLPSRCFLALKDDVVLNALFKFLGPGVVGHLELVPRRSGRKRGRRRAVATITASLSQPSLSDRGCRCDC